jgi:hypothetical protein
MKQRIRPKNGFSINLVLLFIIAAYLLASCGNKTKYPDTSKIQVELDVVRFEQEFFGIDTTNLDASIEKLRAKHHNFTNDFVFRILGLEGVDTALWSTAIKQFYRDYKPIYDSTRLQEEEIMNAFDKTKEGLKNVNYYFPKYNLPEQFITFVGPIDAFASGSTGGSGDIITTFALGIGLQLHLGANSSIYNSEQGMQLYPTYISRKFTPEYIPVNSMKNAIDDILPPIKNGASLLEVFIDHGKRMYLLDLFLPETEDTLKLGYSASQLKGAEKNEGLIWNYFLENNLLYETDPFKIRSFINEGPSTMEFGEGSPGFISLFVGRQIIQAYIDKHPETTLDALLNLDAKKIFSASGYKPR